LATTKAKIKKQTPLMQQYNGIKQQHPDAILLFRVGDFYETFGEDAIAVAQALGIVLTKRNNGGSKIELAGFPYHSLDMYLPRLVKAGFRVAICEQLEKPSKEKKIVARGVTEMVTPGIATDDKLLEYQSNNYLCAVYFDSSDTIGVAFLDLSTGEFLVSEGSKMYMDKLLQSFGPSEIIFSRKDKDKFANIFGDRYYTYPLDEWIFTEDFTTEKLNGHFQTNSLKGFGIEEMHLAKIAAGSIFHYLATTENKNLLHITCISRIPLDRYMWLDKFTIRNLELIYSPHERGVPLLQILNKTVSPMGARLMKKWVVLPLKDLKEIEARHNKVDYFIQSDEVCQKLIDNIQQVGDIERIIAKVPMLKINPREVVQLSESLRIVGQIKAQLNEMDEAGLKGFAKHLDECPELRQKIGATLVAEPPNNLSKGGVVAEGANEDLDEYRRLVHDAKSILKKVQLEEAEKTGIDNLKIGFNSVFGYYLEVTNKYKDKGMVPDHWVRKQTLTNAERYITEELKTLEAKILGAEEKISILEEQVYQDLVLFVSDFISQIQKDAFVVARLDCLTTFAAIAKRNNYCRPALDDSLVIDIKSGRHPVIEHHLPIGESYVPNDILLDNHSTQIMMITGPNMAGKSALLRQVAIISIMAQMGSFVPAASARLGIIDKVFTRVGATDNISSGESTFMVEMNETASIMNNISERSLILMDEIGRGTSTYDGISIAWALAEYLHTNQTAKPKTLFATHYHELNELSNTFERIKNYNIATKEVGQKVIFLRKLQPGGSNHSFGIYVAKLAGMPSSIISRANEILSHLETKSMDQNEKKANIKEAVRNIPAAPMQLSIFDQTDEAAKAIKLAVKDLNINDMTPVECMLKLNELKGLVEESN
jgi:DNA mismatch repair protein MutS